MADGLDILSGVYPPKAESGNFGCSSQSQHTSSNHFRILRELLSSIHQEPQHLNAHLHTAFALIDEWHIYWHPVSV